LGVTTYLTTDIAAVPLLWVAPLALYLATFVLAFARGAWLWRRPAAAALPVFTLCLALALLTGATEPVWLLVPLHLITFFTAALVCHGELARARPPAERLTEYYLWVAVGGVLGGLFNALLAPLLFRTLGLVEYPLAVLLACALVPAARPAGCRGSLKPLLLGLFTAGLALAGRTVFPEPGKLAMAVLFGVPLLLCAPLMDRPRRFALGLGAIFLAASLHPGLHGPTLFYERNFFGVVRVTAEPGTGWHRMVHGNTVHGRQAWEDGEPQPTPLGYYHPKGPAGAVFKVLNARPGSASVAVCGLGAGALAAYARPGQHWTFYEIDPTVARVAQDPGLFTYLSDCRAEYRVVLGDARLRLRDADRAYDLIVIDCFSSDAIPVHLLTREALSVYLSRLAPGGLLAFHVSNRYLDLKPVLAALAADAGLAECREREDLVVDEDDLRAGRSATVWVALARRTEDLGALARTVSWGRVRPPPGFPVWTDDYSNVLGVFRWNWAD
jgi:spermidine synthase